MGTRFTAPWPSRRFSAATGCVRRRHQLPLRQVLVPGVSGREPDALVESEFAEVAGKQHGCGRSGLFEEVPTVVVAGEHPVLNARLLDTGVARTGRCGRFGQPVHVRDPGGGRDMIAWDRKPPGFFA